MSYSQKFGSLEQTRAEEKIFSLVEKTFGVNLEKNPKLFLANNEYTYTVSQLRFLFVLSSRY